MRRYRQRIKAPVAIVIIELLEGGFLLSRAARNTGAQSPGDRRPRRGRRGARERAVAPVYRGDAMQSVIALLRGVNVGGNRKIPMADLRAVFVEAGCGDVTTYIQSGNVVFTTSARSLEGACRPRAADRDRNRFRRAGGPAYRELAVVVRENPFTTAGPTQLHVAFLGAAPAAGSFDVDRAKFAPEEFVLARRDVYLFLPNGAGRAKLPPALSGLKTATMRNWNTVVKLLELASSSSACDAQLSTAKRDLHTSRAAARLHGDAPASTSRGGAGEQGEHDAGHDEQPRDRAQRDAVGVRERRRNIATWLSLNACDFADVALSHSSANRASVGKVVANRPGPICCSSAGASLVVTSCAMPSKSLVAPTAF